MTSLGVVPSTAAEKRLDRLLQSFDDCLSLVRDSLPLQRFALSLSLGLFYLEYLFRLAARAGRDLLALRGVNLVHRGFHFFVRLDVGDQRLVDGVAVSLHHVAEPVLDRHGNVGLLQKCIIQIHLGHMAENHVEYIRSDLLRRVGQLVESLVDMLRNHVILHRNRNLHKDVVFGLGLNIERELLNPQVHAPGDLVEPGQLEVDARGGHALETCPYAG